MTPDKKPARGNDPKSPEKKPTPVVKPDLTRKPGERDARGKTGGTTKR
jgi:hypothetical protein